MKKHGIDAYFSGCLTSTLNGNPNFKRLHSVDERGDYVLLVDIPTNIENRIKSVSGNVPVYNVSRMLSGAFDPIKRLDVAKCMLALYHNARCVVTSRLHAALPATAFETPVCLVNFEQEDRAGRFDGLMELFNQVDEKDFDSNTVGYDFVNPPANPTVYLKMRENLVSVCKEFTGFDSEKSIFEDSYQPLAVLIGCLKDDRSVMNRFLRYATPNELLSALYDRQINGANRFDV
jgi:hypothetical protein